MTIGEIDPRCIAPTNRPPALTHNQAAAHTGTPDAETWSEIKRRSVEHSVTRTITGVNEAGPGGALSRGRVRIRNSTDLVGAPIFYRDVPLMPSEVEKGVIKPLAPAAIPLIVWRPRDIAGKRSRLMMEGLRAASWPVTNAYAEAGHFPKAVQIAIRLLELAREQNNRQMTDALQERLALYQTGAPFREERPAPGNGH